MLQIEWLVAASKQVSLKYYCKYHYENMPFFFFFPPIMDNFGQSWGLICLGIETWAFQQKMSKMSRTKG